MTDITQEAINDIKSTPLDGRIYLDVAILKGIVARAERAEHELNEWKRGDVGQANRLMADRCVNAEHVARNATARAEKAEAALAGPESPLAERMRHRAIAAEAALAAAESDRDIARLSIDNLVAEASTFDQQLNASTTNESELRAAIVHLNAKVATARAVMAEEAARWFTERAKEHAVKANEECNREGNALAEFSQLGGWAAMELAAEHIRALALLPAGLSVVEHCHICGSIDAVVTERTGLCSKGHFSDPARLPAGLVVLPVEVTEWIADHLTTELRNMNESDSCDDCGTLDDHESDCFALELERRIAALDAAGGATK